MAADPSIADLVARLDRQAADLLLLRQQLSAGVGVPDMASQSGKFLTNDGTMPSWAPTPTAVTSITVTAPITSTGGTTPTLGHANSGATAGTYTYPTITVDARGHITGISNGTAPVTSVTATSPIVSSGGATPNMTHATSGVGAGSYAYPTSITVNAYGHVTAIKGGSAPSVSWGSITGTLSAQTDLNTALNARGALASANTWTNKQTMTAIAVGGSWAGTLPAATVADFAAGTSTGVNWVQTVGPSYSGAVLGMGSGILFGSTFNASWGGGDTQPRYNAGIAVVPNEPVGGQSRDHRIALYINSSANDTPAEVVSWSYTGGMKLPTGMAITTTGKGTFGSLGLPGTISQYVDGTGALRTFPSVGSGTVTSVAQGSGLSGSTITTSGTITLGTPSTCSDSTSNAVTGTSHTHALQAASASVGGVLTSGTQSIVGAKTFTTSISSASVTQTSDARFKREVRSVRDGLAIVRALRPRRFFNLLTQRYDIGFIAQDLRGVLPECVAVGEDGRLSVAYANIVAPLAAAVQALDAQVRDLRVCVVWISVIAGIAIGAAAWLIVR